MRRSKHSGDDLNDIARRLRDERPTASPLTLDQIKTSTMARVRSLSSPRGLLSRFTGQRRLVLTGLTVGLMAAGTGSVLAAGGGNTATGNAAEAQYSTSCSATNVGNGDGNNDGNCDSGSNDGNNNGNTVNNITNITNNAGDGGGVVNNYYSTTTTVTMTTTSSTATGAVQAFSETKKATAATRSKRHILIHLGTGRHRIRSVEVQVNGVVKSIKYGKQASPNIKIVDPPCYKGTTTVRVVGKLANGKTVQSIHYYHLCVAGVGKVE